MSISALAAEGKPYTELRAQLFDAFNYSYDTEAFAGALTWVFRLRSSFRWHLVGSRVDCDFGFSGFLCCPSPPRVVLPANHRRARTLHIQATPSSQLAPGCAGSGQARISVHQLAHRVRELAAQLRHRVRTSPQRSASQIIPPCGSVHVLNQGHKDILKCEVRGKGQFFCLRPKGCFVLCCVRSYLCVRFREDWRSLFDLNLVYGLKPAFFAQIRPFYWLGTYRRTAAYNVQCLNLRRTTLASTSRFIAVLSYNMIISYCVMY